MGQRVRRAPILPVANDRDLSRENKVPAVTNVSLVKDGRSLIEMHNLHLLGEDTEFAVLKVLKGLCGRQGVD
jgi:hypothetical protein